MPATCNNSLLSFLIVLPMAFCHEPKYLSAVSFVSAAKLGFASTEAGSPYAHLKLNISKKPGLT